jgi:glutamate-1-semialdehyde 2,1-aminomutase
MLGAPEGLMADTNLLNISLQNLLRDAEERFALDNPRSAKRYAEALDSMPGGNTRTVLHYTPFPLTIAKGEGSRLWDLDGHIYVDLLAEYTAGLFGHSHPVILAAVRGAIDRGISFGGPNENEARLADIICRRFPSIELVRFCNSGSEANLIAVAAARGATGRGAIMTFNGAYHGAMLGFANGGGALNAPYPIVLAEYNDVEGTLARIDENADELAAILIEPMMGGGGGIPADRSFLEALRERATRYGIVLIFDEVMTSRISAGGLQAKLGVVPDMTTLGKYIGGGMSFGAFGGRRDIMSRFDPRRADAWAHAGTFNNNVLTMAAGVAAMSSVYTPEVAEQLTARGDRLRDRLNEIGHERGLPVQVTGVGSILAVHFQSRPIRRPADTKETPPELRALFHLEMLTSGFYLARRGFMSLSVALAEADYDGFRPLPGRAPHLIVARAAFNLRPVAGPGCDACAMPPIARSDREIFPALC